MKFLVSAEAVKMFVSRLVESDRIKRAMRVFLSKVNFVTVCCKQFVETTRKRHAEMTHQWKVVEDYHLSTHFTPEVQMGSRKSEKKVTKRKSTKPERTSSKEIADNLGVLIQPDWWELRIPERERNAVIRRYYTAQLLKHIRDQAALCDAVTTMMSQQQELSGFFAPSVSRKIG